MNILFCGDKNIKDGLIISLLSLAKHTREPLNVYILTLSFRHGDRVCEPLSSDFAEFLQGMLIQKGNSATVTLIDVSDKFIAYAPLVNIETRFTPGCMLRLFADMLPELPSKLLYLDNDIICRSDLTELYSTDMTDTEVAGVLDHYGKWFFKRNIFKFDYVNSGVLLMNLDKIRETGLFEKCRHRCQTKKMFMPDQSAINKLSVSKKFLKGKFNEQRKLRDDTVIHHFTTSFRFFPYFHSVSVKPWRIDEVHSVLKLYEYDGLLSEYLEMKSKYETSKDKAGA
ncbi:MAG: glycosyltransferase family 8 protein [Ruminococcus sp.]